MNTKIGIDTQPNGSKMYKYILVMMSVNDTPTLPVAIQLSDFNTGYYDTTDVSEIPALLAFINYTLFKYSPFDDDDLNDVDYFFINYNFDCHSDTWIIDRNEYRYHNIKEITYEEFQKLNSLNLLGIVNPFNYEGKYLTKNGSYKFNDYMSSLTTSFKNQFVKDFKKVAFDLNSKDHLDNLHAINIADLLSSYNFGSCLENICTVNKNDGSRLYKSYTLDGSFSGDDIQLVFSNYVTVNGVQEYTSIEPINFEILINDEEIDNTELDEIVNHYGYMINIIKTDLYKNTFK